MKIAQGNPTSYLGHTLTWEKGRQLLKGNKVDLSKFGTRLPNGQGWKGPDDWKIIKDFARHAAKKWKLYKAKKRIASLLEDGTIYGK